MLNSSLMINRFKLAFLLICILLTGCRGYRSQKEPIHLNPNLDFQAKYKAQAFSGEPVAATIPWGDEESFSENNRADYDKSTAFNTGKVGDVYLAKIPMDVNSVLLKRGEERFNIYCSVCHDKAGSGKGTVVERGFLAPPKLYEDRIIAYTDGELFSIISNGIRNMPGYARQIPEKDRWAIVSYVRALQKLNHASIKDVPEQLRDQIEE